MGEIVNLNRYRKAREQQRREQEAGVNRARTGRVKGEKQSETAARERTRRDLDGKKLDEPA
ncbi:MAG: DUF4169 family protein [Rhodospirillaceae bacterium]